MTLPDLTHWSQRHPLLVLLLALLVLFGGLLAVGRLPIDPPTFSGDDRIQVRIHDPGVPADSMEQRVAQPLEEVLADIPGVKDIVSRSVIGATEVVLFVSASGNFDAVERQVVERLAQAREKMPASIDAPALTRHRGTDAPVAELLISSTTLSLAQLQKWTEDSLVPQFSDMAGYARYTIIGGPQREIQVIPDQRRLAALGLNLEDVVEVLRRYQAHTASPGQIGVPTASAQAVESLSIRLADGDTVALSEVVRAQEGERQEGARVYRNAIPVLRLLLYAEPRRSTLEMGEASKARLAWLRTNRLIPETVQVEWLAHPLLGLKRMGRSYLTLSTAVLLLSLVAIGALYRRGRVVWVSAGAAVISLMLVFIYYKLAGLVIYPLSLAGMIVGYAFVLGLPLLTFDRLRWQLPGADAAVARAEAQHRLMTVLMLVLLVLLPITAWGGLLGRVFPALVTGLLATLAASVLTSLIWVPAFTGPSAPVRVSTSARRYAQWWVSLQPGRRWLAAGTLLFLAVIPFGVYHLWNTVGFLPPWDTSELRLGFVMPADLDRKQTERVLRALEDVARRNGEVHAILTQMGGMDPVSADGIGRNEVVLRIERQETGPRRSAMAWRRDFERLLATTPPLSWAAPVVVADPYSVTDYEDSITLASTGEISLHVMGPDRGVLAGIGADLRARLAKVPGLRNVRLAGGGEQDEQVAQPDPERAAPWAVDDITLARVLRIAQGGLLIGHSPDARRGIGLRLVLPAISRQNRLPRLLLRGEVDDQAAVYLNDVANSSMTHRSLIHWREHALPRVEVRASLATDVVTDVATDIPGRTVIGHYKEILQETVLPAGYQIRQLGFFDSLQRFQKQVLILIGASFLMLLLLLALRLRTWGGALLILANVLFAFAGGVTVILVFGLPLSLPLGLGGVLLVAMAAVPPLIVVDAQRSGRQGLDTYDVVTALRPARPLLIFGFTGLLSLLPLASGRVPGFESLQALALVLSAGLGFSLLGSLFLLPVLFSWLRR